MIPQSDVTDLIAAFRLNPNDIGIGLYNPSTGVIRVGSFDLVTQRQGHQGLADALGITDNNNWRGYLVTSDGNLIPTSHFNLVDGGLSMMPKHEAIVRQELRQVGLLN